MQLMSQLVHRHGHHHGADAAVCVIPISACFLPGIFFAVYVTQATINKGMSSVAIAEKVVRNHDITQQTGAALALSFAVVVFTAHVQELYVSLCVALHTSQRLTVSSTEDNRRAPPKREKR
jgi:hypothetical protein